MITTKLRQVLAAKHLAHAYLLAGPRGIGKRSAALLMAKAVLCDEHPREIRTACPCNSCRAVESAMHPDLFHLSCKDTEKAREISIDDVRELKNRFLLTASFGGYKIAVIERVELLGREAASAMLKLLEEPSGEALIIMTSDRPRSVLATS